MKAVLGAMNDLSKKLKESEKFSKKVWKQSYDKKVTLLNKQLEIVSIDVFDPEAVFKLNKDLGYQDFK